MYGLSASSGAAPVVLPTPCAEPRECSILCFRSVRTVLMRAEANYMLATMIAIIKDGPPRFALFEYSRLLDGRGAEMRTAAQTLQEPAPGELDINAIEE